MKGYVSSLLPRIEANYHNFTNLEKTIADFFLNNTEKLIFQLRQFRENCLFPKHLFLGLRKK